MMMLMLMMSNHRFGARPFGEKPSEQTTSVEPFVVCLPIIKLAALRFSFLSYRKPQSFARRGWPKAPD